MKPRARTIAILPVLFLLLAGLPARSASPPEVAVDAEDVTYALSLLETINVEVTADRIQRVLRDNTETVVWVQSSFEGLPVFNHNIGYVFDADGLPEKAPGSTMPLRLGTPADPKSFPLDHHPDITEAQAIEAYLSRLEREGIQLEAGASDTDLEVVLGFDDLNLGSSRPPEFRLAWRVRPAGATAPEAMVSAKKGDVLRFDSGLRTGSRDNPGPVITVPEPHDCWGCGGPCRKRPADRDPDNETSIVGVWYSPRCDERSYPRSVTFNEDGTFVSSDLVAPCPQGARCVWSGVVVRTGIWRRDGDLIELTPADDNPTGRASPLPPALRWRGEGKLVEVVVGGPMTCEFTRDRSALDADEESAAGTRCGDAVQGQIAWDYKGSTRWAEGNVARLCAGAENSTEPARCFDQAMHGGLPGRTDRTWGWRDAIALCAGTTDAEKTIGCYRAEFHSGSSFEQAISICGAATVHATSGTIVP